jgi:hypothetical protein
MTRRQAPTPRGRYLRPLGPVVAFAAALLFAGRLTSATVAAGIALGLAIVAVVVVLTVLATRSRAGTASDDEIEAPR